MTARPIRPMKTPLTVEHLEDRVTPAKLQFVEVPTGSATGAGNVQIQGVPPISDKIQWSLSGNVTLPEGAPSIPEVFPGSFTTQGNVRVRVVPDAGEYIGTPIRVSTRGEMFAGFGQDPIDPEGGNRTGNEIRLRAGIEGMTPWFDNKYGQPPGSTIWNWASTTLRPKGTSVVDTHIGSEFIVDVFASGRSGGTWKGASDSHGEVVGSIDLMLNILPYTADLQASNLAWNTERNLDPANDPRGVDFTYFTNEDLPNSASPVVKFFWSLDETVDQSDVFLTREILSGRTKGTHTVNFGGRDWLAMPNDGKRYNLLGGGPTAGMRCNGG
jgi:hypothetical protein